MQTVIFKRPGEGWTRIGGMSLFERNLRYLDAAGVKAAWIVHSPEEIPPPIEIPRPLGIEPAFHAVDLPDSKILDHLHDIDLKIGDPVLVFDANLLIEPHVMKILTKEPAPCLLTDEKGQSSGTDWLAAWLKLKDFDHESGEIHDVNRISLGMNRKYYEEELRGEVVPYCRKLSDKQNMRDGWRLLHDRSAKRPADFVEKYVDPPIEDRIVQVLCDTPVTPNQVTLFSLVIGFVGAYFFYQGSFYWGLLAAWIAIILDGVDGKLARIKLMTSPLGEIEHVLDFFFENSWYLALAAFFAQTEGSVAWVVGLSITTCDTLDKILGAIFGKIKGITLDEMSDFDRFFRLIGGRRSIYLPIFLGFLLAGEPYLGFQGILVWALFTVAVHFVRAIYHLARRNPPA